MKKLVYVGNNLKKSSTTVMQTLSAGLVGEGYQVVMASSQPNKILRLLDMLRTIYKHRKTADYVLIDTYSTLNFYYAYVSAKLCKQLNLKYIPVLHGGKLPERLQRSKKMSDSIFNNALSNVAPSGYLKDAFEECGYTNIEFIPNAIDIENYPFKKRNEFNPKLLWVRSFSNLYNPTLAIEVLIGLKNRYPHAKLCMIGPPKDDSHKDVLELIEKNNLHEDVELTGLLSKSDWHDKSKRFDVFINTTNYDNTPVSVIEAMALGLPVVSTNVGGIPYLIEDKQQGLLVEKESADQMITAVSEIIDNQELGVFLSNNARELVAEFDWKSVRNKWKALLN